MNREIQQKWHPPNKMHRLPIKIQRTKQQKICIYKFMVPNSHIKHWTQHRTITNTMNFSLIHNMAGT